MLKKFLLSLPGGNGTLAVKYSGKNNDVVIGGNGRLLEDMYYILVEGFVIDRRKAREVWTQRNKARLLFKMNQTLFDARIDIMSKDKGWTFDVVKNFGRIMR